MRNTARHLPAYLLLLGPLGALAWLGGAELSRQEERAERLLDERARAFLDDAHREFERLADGRSVDLLANLPRLAGKHLVEATEELADQDPWVLDLFVVDDTGALVFPIAPPPIRQGLPFHARGNAPEINTAEILEYLGDVEGAREQLESVLRRHTPGATERWLQRAHFTLAGVLRKLDDAEAAETHYLAALDLALQDAQRSSNLRRGGSAPDSVALLCEVALAELDMRYEQDHVRLLYLMRDVAEGVHSGVPDPLLDVVLDRLLTEIPIASPLHATAIAAIETNEVRIHGRSFAGEDQSFLEQAVRRRLRNADSETRRLLQVHRSDTGNSMLALRRLAPEEHRGCRDRLPEECWVGIRLDLEFGLSDLADRFRTLGDDGFQLRVTDPDGHTMLAAAAEESELPVRRIVSRPSIAGTQLAAIPIAPRRYLEAQRQTLRNRALLLLALFLAAGGGAFFLMRSAARESEIAALKVDLVSRVSHELKTPLALIRMYSETLQLGRTESPEQASRFLGVISREATKLTSMIERVLDFSKQGAGSFVYTKHPTDLGELLSGVTAAYRRHASSDGLELRAHIEPGIVVDVDAGALESAVINLLDNAVKYTPRDGDDRRIDVELRSENSTAIVEVHDRGIGIPPNELARVFDSFYRASNAAESRGAGLGLSLVKHFAESHGGGVSAHARDGGGSTLRISLPRKDPNAETEHPGH